TRAETHEGFLLDAMDDWQIENAKFIIAVIKGHELGEQAAVITLATAIVESWLRNYEPAVDLDSGGHVPAAPLDGLGQLRRCPPQEARDRRLPGPGRPLGGTRAAAGRPGLRELGAGRRRADRPGLRPSRALQRAGPGRAHPLGALLGRRRVHRLSSSVADGLVAAGIAHSEPESRVLARCGVHPDIADAQVPMHCQLDGRAVRTVGRDVVLRASAPFTAERVETVFLEHRVQRVPPGLPVHAL